MKVSIKKIALLLASLTMLIASSYAQGQTKAEAKVNELVKKYENVKGVESMSIGKGLGLTIVKKMLGKKIGKEFMKGVTCFAFIEYGDASEQTCSALQKELDAFSSLLDIVELDDSDLNLAIGDHLRCFAAASEDKTVTDLIIAVENKENKMIMYLGGKIKIDQTKTTKKTE